MTDIAAAQSSRELIAEHARILFEEHGYSGTSVRQIAAAAGVDPSLAIRHFGSKEGLFLTVIGLEGYISPPLEGPVESLGHRLAEFVLAPENLDFRIRLSTLVRASDREAVREGLRLTVRRMFIDRLVDIMPGEEREARALLISAQLGGVVQAAVHANSELLESAESHRLVELFGRSIQALIEPDTLGRADEAKQPDEKRAAHD